MAKPSLHVKLNEFWTVGEDYDTKYMTLAEAEEVGLAVGVKPERHGAQKDFVLNPARRSAYVGGLGSGKTWAGLIKGLTYSEQTAKPNAKKPPVGIVVAETYPILDDVDIPEFFNIVGDPGPNNYCKNWIASKRTAVLYNGAQIKFRSMERPDRIRGIEACWFFIDEGRHLTRAAWELLAGRLRQPGYEHAGWVCSTPNGYDWMWQFFHEDSPFMLDGSQWFGAPTRENLHLEQDYLDDLDATYEGLFYDQEVEGKFIGIMRGAVYPHWIPPVHMVDLEYDPELPLYSFWDFGVGDLGVVIFAQIRHVEKMAKSGAKVFVPILQLIGSIEHTDWGAQEWSNAVKRYCDEWFEGRRPDKNIGDPAGRQRNAATGTSVMQALMVHGLTVIPAPKKAPDYAIFILDNMMAGGRVLADRNKCSRVGAALATHKWNTDEQGNRIGNSPVHDWTSHYSDAVRYGATVLLSHFPKRLSAPSPLPPQQGTFGAVIAKLKRGPQGAWLGGGGASQRDWQPAPPDFIPGP